MSLVSASGLVSGIKEYIYRGIQELPTVLSLTFFGQISGESICSNLQLILVIASPILVHLKTQWIVSPS